MKTEKELVLLPEINFSESKTKRPISEGAENWLGKPIKCLDHGFVVLMDYMGNDQEIANAARKSYTSGTQKVEGAETLIRLLRRNEHTSPFEMGEIKFFAKHPITVARQWVRHRTASLNEISGRYAIFKKEFYIPETENIAVQSKDNKQGRGQSLELEAAKKVQDVLANVAESEYDAYQLLLDDDVAKEISRFPLGTNFYTEWYWKVDLHNFMHFAKLRLDPSAQYEMRVYAQAMAKIISDTFPLSWQAFEDYELNAVKLSQPEQKVLTELVGSKRICFTDKEITTAATLTGLVNRRERQEMIDKFKKLGLLETLK